MTRYKHYVPTKHFREEEINRTPVPSTFARRVPESKDSEEFTRKNIRNALDEKTK